MKQQDYTMRITLKNVGYIKDADINLNGLNVIAGPNGTGKSTVGKTVYTILKSISNSRQIVYEESRTIVESVCRTLFFSIQSNLQQSDIVSRNHDKNLLLENFNASFARVLINLLQNGDYSEAQRLIISQINLIDTFIALDEKSKLSAKKSLNNLMNVFTHVSEQEEIKDSLEVMYNKMFRLQVNNLGTHDTSEILLEDNGDELLKYKVSNNANVLPFSERLSIVKKDKNLKDRVLPEVTFIETPLLIQLADKDNKALPYHWDDLLFKLEDNVEKIQSKLCKSIYEDLSKLLKGELVYLPDKGDFFFVPTNTDNKLYVRNMASGEKMFGILQKMARYGMLSSDHMLIFDEPENHLHPEWQIKLAELFVTLLENDVSILLTTHSSILINALQDFAYSKKLESKVNFYFADPKNGTIDNVDKFSEKEDIIFQSFYDARKLLPDID